jgi:hypothetical protein
MLNLSKRGKADKRGQVTLFVIIAIVVVAIVIVALIVAPKIFKPQTSKTTEPNSYIKDCVNPKLIDNINTLAVQGGYLNPESFITYSEEEYQVQYLCYNSTGKPCVNQKPNLKSDIENQLTEKTRDYAYECISKLKQELDKKGNELTFCQINDIEANVYLKLGKVSWNFTCPMTLKTNNDETIRFEKFSYSINSALNEEVDLAREVVNAEIDNNVANFLLEYLEEHNYAPGKNGQVYNITFDKTETQNLFLFAVYP